MNFMTVQEASKKWGLTKRRIQVLCVQNRISGAEKIGNMWVIPCEAEKPQDLRIKKERRG